MVLKMRKDNKNIEDINLNELKASINHMHKSVELICKVLKGHDACMAMHLKASEEIVKLLKLHVEE